MRKVPIPNITGPVYHTEKPYRRDLPVHMVIPDTQVKKGVPLEHLRWAGQWAAEKKPDVIVHIGDHADMPSLSTYDVGKKSYEGRRYADDIDAAVEGMVLFLAPIREEQARLRAGKRKEWNPRLVLTLGNHEHRIIRAIESDPKLEGTVGLDDLRYEEFGWDVIPYLNTVTIDGIAYSHYFTTGSMGRPVTSARALATKKHMSCTMGHVQQTEIDLSQKTGDGRWITGLFSGIFYQHDEDYLGAQGNNVKRQIWMKYNVQDGQYDPHALSLEYLRRRYG